MGIFSRGQNTPIAGVKPAAPPLQPGTSLGHFGAYDSKAQFMLDWAASVFREAGRDPASRLPGIHDMANIACYGQIWFPLRSLADGSRKSIELLDSLDHSALLASIDTWYPTAIELRGKEQGVRRGLEMSLFASNMGNMFNDHFEKCRAEFVEGVHKGDF